MASSEFVNSFCPQKNLSFFTQKQQKKNCHSLPKNKVPFDFFFEE
jgi:hypothetical protein